MKIKSIKIKNFKSIGNSPYTLNFDNNFTLIRGLPGEGKSTILHAITFCLFGKSADFKGGSSSTLSVNNLINDVNKKETEVQIVLDNNYTIIRSLKPNKFQVLNEKGIDVNELSAKKLDQEVLEQDILNGLDLKMFQTSNYLYGNSTPFLYMSKAQKKDYIEKMLDLRIVYYLNENLKPFISENKLELNKLVSEETLLSSTIENEVFNIQQRIKKNEEQKLKIQNFNENKEQRIQDLNSAIDTTKKDINKITQDIEYIKSDIKTKRDELLEVDEMNYSLLKDNLSKKETLLQKLKDEIQKRKMEKDTYVENKKNYVHCQSCPTLTKIVGSYDMDSYQEFQVKSTTAYKTVLVQIEGIKKDILAIELFKDKNTKIESEINTFMFNLKQEENDLQNKTTLLDNYNKSIEDINKEVPPELIEINKEYLEELKSKKELNTKNKEQNYNQKVDLDKLKKEINDKEHKAKSLKSFLPLFENKLNELLQRFCENHFEFDITCKLLDDFELEFYKNGRVIDIFSLSTGQKGIISLSVTFSFLYLMEIKQMNSFEHIFIDEILDSSLNILVLDVLDYLKELSTKGKNITIISHNQHLIEYPEFDKVINVEKKGTFSTYTEV